MTTPNETIMVLLAEEADAGERIDRFITARLADISRSRVASLLRQGHVRGEAGTIVELSYRVKPGERYQIEVPPPEDATPRPEAIALNIVHEDVDLIVIDKPAGLVVHPAAGHQHGTLVNALLHHCGASLSGIGGVRRPGIVHRLDKDTSGLIVVAKNDAAHQALAGQFADHGRTGPLERAYLAFVWGTPRRRADTIDLPIARHPSDRLRQAVARAGTGREARTHYQIVEQYPAPNSASETTQSAEIVASLVRCRLETGRTHQIRVHMAALGTPVIGDDVYGSGFRNKITKLPPAAEKAVQALGRQALHAAVLGFAHPRDGSVMHFESRLPTEMAAIGVELTQL